MIKELRPSAAESYLQDKDEVLVAGRVYQTVWPEYDEEKTKESAVEIVVQVNGKIKANLTVSVDIDKESAVNLAKEALGGKLTGTIVKEIYVPGRLVNLVVKP